MKLNPDHASAHYNIGILMIELKLKGAGVHCRRAAEIDPAFARPECDARF